MFVLSGHTQVTGAGGMFQNYPPQSTSPAHPMSLVGAPTNPQLADASAMIGQYLQSD